MAPPSDVEPQSPLHGVLLHHILSFLDLYSLLEAAAVNSEFRMSAAAVLSRIDLPSASSRAISHLQVYLHQHGPHLTSLKLHAAQDGDYCYGVWVELRMLPPLPHLQQLSLADVHLQLGPSSTSSDPGVLAAVAAAAGPPGLTLLSIDGCRLLDGPGGLAGLSAPTSLRHLHLAGYYRVNDSRDKQTRAAD